MDKLDEKKTPLRRLRGQIEFVMPIDLRVFLLLTQQPDAAERSLAV